jgi:hypothetical protein
MSIKKIAVLAINDPNTTHLTFSEGEIVFTRAAHSFSVQALEKKRYAIMQSKQGGRKVLTYTEALKELELSEPEPAKEKKGKVDKTTTTTTEANNKAKEGDTAKTTG